MTSEQAEVELCTYLKDILYLTESNATYVIKQGYNTARKFILITEVRMTELFDANARISTIRVAKIQNTRVPRASIQNQEASTINI